MSERGAPSAERNGNFLDEHWCCKVCDGEIPYGHTDDCYIWELEKRHRDFIANEYNTAVTRIAELETERAKLLALWRAARKRENGMTPVERAQAQTDYRAALDALGPPPTPPLP